MPSTARLVCGIHRAVATICGAAARAPAATAPESRAAERHPVEESSSRAIHRAAAPMPMPIVKMSAARKSRAKRKASVRNRDGGEPDLRPAAQTIQGRRAMPAWMCEKNASPTTTPESTYVTAPIHAAAGEPPIDATSTSTPIPAAVQWTRGKIRADTGNGSAARSARTG